MCTISLLRQIQYYEKSAVADSGMVLDSRSRGCGFEQSPEAVCCVLEQDTLSSSCLVLVQSRKTHPDMTKKLLTGM